MPEAAQLVRLQPAAVLGAKRRAEEAEVAEGGGAVDEAAERAAGAAEADELGARQQEVRDDELDVGDGQHLGEQVDAMRCGRGRRRVGDAWDAIVLKRLVVLVVGGRPRRDEPNARRQLVRRAERRPHLGEQRGAAPSGRLAVAAAAAARWSDDGDSGRRRRLRRRRRRRRHGANSCGRRTQRARTSLRTSLLSGAVDLDRRSTARSPRLCSRRPARRASTMRRASLMLVCTSCSAVYQAPTLLRKPQTATRLRRCVASVAAPPQSTAATTTLDVKAWLAERVGEALGEAFGAEYAGADPLITPATKPEFGDYQCSVAMGLGKRLKSKPRDVASSIVAALKVDECFEPTEIAGPGFLNLRLKPDFIRAAEAHARRRRRAARDPAGAAGRPRRRRLLVAQHREGDARRPPALHHHRRHVGARPRFARPRRPAPQPRRRLGHPVRHAHHATARRGAGGRLGRAAPRHLRARCPVQGQGGIRRERRLQEDEPRGGEWLRPATPSR